MKEFHKERNTKAFYGSQSFNKLWSSIKDFIKTKVFQDFILGLREKYEIPEGGFEIKTKSWTLPPPEWKYKKRSQEDIDVTSQIREICKEFQLPLKDWESSFHNYLFYNLLTLSPDPNSHNLCYVTDILENKDSMGSIMTEDIKISYPIGLLISPYASKRDIMDYITKLYTTEILPFQKKYKKKGTFIGKSRSKISRIQNRDNLIYKNRNLSLKEISQMIKKDFDEDLDVGHIGKIISREKKKRQ